MSEAPSAYVTVTALKTHTQQPFTAYRAPDHRRNIHQPPSLPHQAAGNPTPKDLAPAPLPSSSSPLPSLPLPPPPQPPSPLVGANTTTTAGPAANFVDVTFSDFAVAPMAPRPGPTMPSFVVHHAAENFPAKGMTTLTGADHHHRRRAVLPRAAPGQPEPRKPPPSRTKSAHVRRHAAAGSREEPAGWERGQDARRSPPRRSPPPFSERRRTETGVTAAYGRRESDAMSGSKSSTASTYSRRAQRRMRDKENVDFGPPIVFAGTESKTQHLPMDVRTQSHPTLLENLYPPSPTPRRRSVRLSLTRGLRYDADDCDVQDAGADYQDDDYLAFVAPPTALRKAPSTLNSYLSRLVHHKLRE